MTINKLRLFIRLIGLGAIAIVMIWFVLSDMGLNGRLTSYMTPELSSSILTELYPANRIQQEAGEWRIVQEPVYFDARLSNLFDYADINVYYKNECCANIKIGIRQQDQNDWAYQLQTLDNQSFNTIQWPFVTEDNLILWQRENKFSSIQDFLSNIEQIDRVASYNVKLNKSYKIKDYKDFTKPQSRPYILRGSFYLYTYVKDKLDLTIKFKDLNRANNEDNIIITISDINGNKIKEDLIADDGFITAIDPASPEQTFAIKLDNLKEGVYKIDWLTNYDIFTTELITPHKYLTFANSLYLANSFEYKDGISSVDDKPSLITTNSTELRMSTSHPLGLQEIRINDEFINISELHKKYTIRDLANINTAYIPKNDIMLEGNGYFAFSQNEFFQPNSNTTEIINEQADFDFFLAKYSKPYSKNDIANNSVRFSLHDVAIDNGKIRFIISAPGVSEINPLIIKGIEINYSAEKKNINFANIIKYIKYWYRSN